MDNLIRLENLPNELLICIFKYLDARNLYHSFYNLNQRFNILLNSLTNLCLVLQSSNTTDNYDYLFTSRISTLVIHNDVIFHLSLYTNLRHLILYNSKHDQICQVMNEGSHLESLSLISPRCFYTTFIFHEMIFSNKFPYLKSCYLTSVYSPTFTVRQLSWSQSPSLNSLRISSRDSLIHVAILNVCPNLNTLYLSLDQLEHTPLDIIKPHQNLKRLKFILNNCLWPTDESIFKTFFTLIPYLEQLIIQRSTKFSETMNNFVQFDCLAKVFLQQLPYLKQFVYYLNFLDSQKSNSFELENFIDQMKKNFVNIFQSYEYYQLHIKKS